MGLRIIVRFTSCHDTWHLPIFRQVWYQGGEFLVTAGLFFHG
jgi:hypothetical protein